MSNILDNLNNPDNYHVQISRNDTGELLINENYDTVLMIMGKDGIDIKCLELRCGTVLDYMLSLCAFIEFGKTKYNLLSKADKRKLKKISKLMHIDYVTGGTKK